MAVDWSGAASAGTAVKPWMDAQQGATFGYDMGQKLATLNALKNYDPNDPNATNNVITGLIHANALDAATSLTTLTNTRALNAAKLPLIVNALSQANSQLGGAQASPQPQTATSFAHPGEAHPQVPGAGTYADGSPAFHPDSPEFAHQAQTMGQAEQAATLLLKTPEGPRRAQLAQQIGAQFAKLGVPQQAIDEEMGDLSDDHLTAKVMDYRQHLKMMQDAAGAQGQDGAPQEAAAPGTAPPEAAPSGATPTATSVQPGGDLMAGAPPAVSSAMDQLNNPALTNPIAVSALESAGLPGLSGALARDAALVQPYISKSAEIAGAAPLAGVEVAKQLNIANNNANVSVLQHAREKAIDAGYSVISLKRDDGSEVQGVVTRDADGKSTFTPIHAGGGGGQGAGGGQDGSAPKAGVSQTPQAQAQAVHFATQAADMLAPKPDDVTKAQTDIATAQRVLAMANTIKLDVATPLKARFANLLRAAGSDKADQYANDFAAIDSAIRQNNMDALHTAFPQRITDRDLKFGQSMLGSATTPNDQVRFLAGMQEALAQRQLNWEKFKAGYDGPKDNPQQIHKAWLQGEGGQSLYLSPVWQGIKIAGRPALEVKTVTENGHSARIARFGGGVGKPLDIPVQ